MDKKLTDAEIVKALECCLANTNDNCSVCCFSGSNQSCIDVLIQYALDLINRQDEEINRLQAENERLKNIGDNKTKELLRHNIFIEELHKKIKTAKAEAYKEFAERLDNETFGVYYASSLYHVVDIDDVKEILKELVGEDKCL